MTYQVHLIIDAEMDLFDIYQYRADIDTPERAEQLLNDLEKACLNLETLPDRGHFPPELQRLGIFEYREIHFHVYRIIYEVVELDVFVHCILDGRRDLQDLLQQRLLRT